MEHCVGKFSVSRPRSFDLPFPQELEEIQTRCRTHSRKLLYKPSTQQSALFSLKTIYLLVKNITSATLIMAFNDYQSAFWEAAKDMDIPDARDETYWPMLKMSLKQGKVDLLARKPAEWMKSFNRLRKVFERWRKELLQRSHPQRNRKRYLI